MASGLLRVSGTIDLDQFCPKSSSDADTTNPGSTSCLGAGGRPAVAARFRPLLGTAGVCHTVRGPLSVRATAVGLALTISSTLHPCAAATPAESVIEFDAYTRKFVQAPPTSVREGQYVTLRVTDVNTLLYDVTISGAAIPRFLDSRDLGILQQSLGRGVDAQQVSQASGTTQFTGSDRRPTTPDEVVARVVALEDLSHALEHIALSDIQKPSEIRAAAEKLWASQGPSTGQARVEGATLLEGLAQLKQSNLEAATKARVQATLGRRDAILTTLEGADILILGVRSALFEVNSLPQQASDQAISFDLSIKRRPDLPSSIVTSRDIVANSFVTAEVLGGTHVDVAPGIMFSSVTDLAYVAIDGKIRRRGERDLLRAVPSTLIHVYKRRSRSFSSGLSFGIGLAEGRSAHYLLGGSLFFGQKRRWIATAGLSGGYRKALADGLEDGGPAPPTTTPSPSIPTADKFGLGGFLGVSFNLGS